MRPALQCVAAASAPRYERRRPEQTPLYRLVQQHYETFAAEVERAATGTGLPQFVKDEFDAYLDCGIPRLRGGGAFSPSERPRRIRWRKASCACFSSDSFST